MNVQLNIFDAAIEAEKEMANIMAVQSAQKAATKRSLMILEKKLVEHGKICGRTEDLFLQILNL